MTRLAWPARVAAVAALLVAAGIAAWLLMGGGAPYEVRAEFVNASQLVRGNLVQVGGVKAGQVKDIDVTDDGHAVVTLTVSDDYAPLRRGTKAVVRQASLSGIANRYVDLQLGPQRGERIPDGGALTEAETTSAVDLDQLFNTLDPDTRESLQQVIQGAGDQVDGRSEQMQAALPYLNPALAASTRLFNEVNRDTELLERFVLSSSRLVTDLAEREDDLAGVVDDLATTMKAVGAERQSLADSIEQLPPVMRRANTTFVNLRSTLDDLDPLVEDSKPVARKLRPLFDELRPLARDSRPTLRDLARTISRRGRNNDLIDLNNAMPAVRDVAIRGITENGKRRAGAFPQATRAMRESITPLTFIRPYAPDLLGWFDDFSHSGVYDALGGSSRVSLSASAFALLNGQLKPVPPELRGEAFKSGASLRQDNRCPGAGEHEAPDGSGPFRPTPDFNCDPSQVLPGD